MPLVRILARARVSHPDFNLYPGDEADMPAELATNLGMSVQVLGPSELAAERGADDIASRDRMQRGAKNRTL